MPSAPVVTVVTKYLLLNQLISAADLFTVSDPDGDTITRYRFTDLSSEPLSGYFQLDGERRAQGALSEITSAQLPSFDFVASSTIGSERIRIQAYDGALWSNPVELQVIYVRENTTKPIVTASALTMVESDYVNLNSFITATDPDGWPITLYYLRDQQTTGGYLRLDSELIPQGTYRYYTPTEFNRLRYYAVSPNQAERIEVYAYDGVSWSDYKFSTITTRTNFSAPTTSFSSRNVAAGYDYPINDSLNWFDSDGNQLKVVEVFESNTSPSTGTLVYNGVVLAPNRWHSIPYENIAGLVYRTGGVATEETIQYRVSDGKFTSNVSDIRYAIATRPELTYEPYVVEPDLQDIPARQYFSKGDTGPAYTTYQIQDLNGSTTASARLILDGRILNANVVHTLTAAEFNRLIIRTAQYQDRAIDPILVRARNSFSWTDWVRTDLYTEPEIDDFLRNNSFSPTPDADQFNDWGDWLFMNGERSDVITFSFMQQLPGYDLGNDVPGDNNDQIPPSFLWGDGGTFSRFTPEMRTVARGILADVDGFVNSSFLEVQDDEPGPDPEKMIYGGQGGVIRMGLFRDEPPEDDPDNFARVVVFGPDDPVANEAGGDLMFNTYWLDRDFPTWTTPGAWSKDGDLYLVMLSAMGAALGLIDPDSVPRLPQGTNNQDNTIYGIRPSTSGAIAGDYMLYDVHALQWLYNPDPDLRADDTLYNFDFFGRKTDILRSIVDAGGVDTISAAGMEASFLDLGPGNFSSLGGLTAASSEVRFSIPLKDTLIENLIGSNFDDTLNGNFLANKIEGGSGRDTITGKVGNDLLMGGAGNDLYIYRLGDGFDTINENAGAGRDTLRVDSAGTLDSFSQDFSFRREGNDLIVDLRLDKADYVEGSIRIVNQKWGSWGVEIFRFGPLGGTIQNIDLTNVYAQSTTVSQNFKVLTTTSTFGFLVAPV
ncbi:MAG: hypothetical protein ACKO0N_17945 [Planctomycetota bacterium]